MDCANDWLDFLKYGLPSGFVFSLFTWLVSIKKRKNDFISDLQKSIDLLSAKYKESVEENLKLMEKNTTLYADNLQLASDKALLLANQEKMARKIEILSRKIDELTKQLKAKKNAKANQKVPSPSTACPTSDCVRDAKENGVIVDETGADQESEGTKGRRRTRQPRPKVPIAANDGEPSDLDNPLDDGGGAGTGGDSESDDGRPP